MKTFRETPRLAGTCYRAASWIHVGETQGRGKFDTHSENAKRDNEICVKPLCRDWKTILNRDVGSHVGISTRPTTGYGTCGESVRAAVHAYLER